MLINLLLVLLVTYDCKRKTRGRLMNYYRKEDYTPSEMSTEPKNGMPSRRQFKNNMVKCDGRLKEVIHLEKLMRRQWEKKWGFSRNIMKIYHDDIKAEGIELKEEKPHPWLVSEMNVSPSPSVPITSSGFIGWRSAVEECSLERVGPLYVSPKLTIEHPEDYPPSKQINIFIG